MTIRRLGGFLAASASVPALSAGQTSVVGQVGAGNGAVVYKNGVALASSAFTVDASGNVTVTTSALAAGDQITAVPLVPGKGATATVPGYAALAISGTPQGGAVGGAYTFTPTVSGGAGAKTFSFAGTLQPGFSFASSTGTLSGTPTTSATQTGTITATDGAGNKASLSISITVATGYAFGTPLAFVGDSITDPGYSSMGYAVRTVAKTSGRYTVAPLGNRGSAGATALEASLDLGSLTDILASSPTGVCVVMLGTNADTGGQSVTTASLRKIYDRIIAAGWKIIACTIPNSAASNTVNQFINAQTDIAAVIPTNTIITSAKTVDGTHFNDQGSEDVANAIAQVLNNWSAAQSQDLYTNDVTSLQPDFSAGTAGRFNATGVSGVAPTGWQFDRYSGDGTITVNPVQDGGATAIEVVFTAGTTETRLFMRPITDASAVADDHMDMWMEFKTVSGGPKEFLMTFGGNSGSWMGGYTSYNMNLLTSYLPYRTIAKGSTGNQNLWVFITVAAGQSCTLRLRRPRITKRTVAAYKPRGAFDGGNRPNVSGTPKVGQVLTMTPRNWWGKPLPCTPSYQWVYADGTPISGATSSTYTLVSADVGKQVSCLLTETNATGSTTYQPNATAAVTAT